MRLTLRATEEEHEAIVANARKYGLTMNEYVKRCAIRGPRKKTADPMELQGFLLKASEVIQANRRLVADMDVYARTKALSPEDAERMLEASRRIAEQTQALRETVARKVFK